MDTEQSNGLGLPVKLLVVGIFAVMIYSFFHMDGVEGNVIDSQAECAAAWNVYVDGGSTALSESEYMARCKGPVEVRNINSGQYTQQ